MGQYVFKLPDVGEGTAEAEIVAWHVRVGEMVQEDSPLVDVMTDKATVEMTAPVSGKIVSLHGEPGEMAPVGSAIAVFETEAEAEAPAAPAKPNGAHAEAKAAPTPEPKPEAKPAAPQPKPRIRVASGAVLSTEDAQAAYDKSVGKKAPPPASQSLARRETSAPAVKEWGSGLASPAVRQRAQKLGVDLSTVQGTGPGGRITHDDLDSVLVPARRTGGRAVEPKSGIEPVKVIGLRRKIAQKMQEAKRRIPHFSYVEECDLTELEDLRAHLNSTRRADQPKLSLLPFLMRAMALALPDFPQINARYDDDNGVVYRHEAVDIGIATQTEAGLVVPVVRHIEARDIWSCAAEVSRLAAAVRSNTAAKEELSGATITITSLGALGGIVTTPVINHPEVAIIGVNKMVERPVVKHGQIVVRKMMNLSSSFDHRVVDGYDAAEFIQKVKGLLEHPAALFM
jgi:2-oxoisovalerate dehydrogenase E2 component (dihydrolipoyl transacylase)